MPAICRIELVLLWAAGSSAFSLVPMGVDASVRVPMDAEHRKAAQEQPENVSPPQAWRTPKVPVRPPVALGGQVLPETWVWDQLAAMSLEVVAPESLALSDTRKERYEFMHIPKTAGTTVERAGKAAGLHWGSKKHAFHGFKMSMPDGNVCSPWHVPGQMLEMPHGPVPYKKAEGVFCVTRHPYNKFVSEYTWRVGLGVLKKRGGYPECSEGSLNNYLQFQLNHVRHGKRWVQDCHFLPQSAFIWDGASGKQWCTEVLRFDDLPNEMSKLMGKWGLPVTIASTNANPSGSRCPGLDTRNLSSHTRHLIRKIYKSDFERLDYDPDTIY